MEGGGERVGEEGRWCFKTEGEDHRQVVLCWLYWRRSVRLGIGLRLTEVQ
jgi:hypothetical protein